MVGADHPATFEKAKSLLLDMGKNVTHCGKVGSGGAVKICNNSKYSKIFYYARHCYMGITTILLC